MEPTSLKFICDAVAGSLHVAREDPGPGIKDLQITDVCFDSRRAKPGALFFALKGENTDGHRFVPQALAAGAIAIVSDPIDPRQTGGMQIVVADPLIALGDLAQAYRRQFEIPVTGITGSVGKTSVRSMLSHILSASATILASEGNFNNEIGLPITILGLKRSHSAMVVEMGMRGVGEIRRLAEIARPDSGIITNIGYSHIERLGSREAIAEAKAELFELLPANGMAVVPEDIAFRDLVLSRLTSSCNVVTTGGPGADIQIVEMLNPGQASCRNNLSGETFELAFTVPGAHHVDNGLLAIAGAYRYGISSEGAAARLASWMGADGRLTVRTGKWDITVLDDCYNAAVESMESALKTLAAYPVGRVAILGDMRELGQSAEYLHERVGQIVRQAGLRLLITVGNLARIIGETASSEVTSDQSANTPESWVHFTDTESCSEQIEAMVLPGDTVLVKGSRALAMERIVAHLALEELCSHG